MSTKYLNYQIKKVIIYINKYIKHIFKNKLAILYQNNNGTRFVFTVNYYINSKNIKYKIYHHICLEYARVINLFNLRKKI